MPLQRVDELGLAQGFGQRGIHARRHDLVHLFAQGMGGQGDDGDILPTLQLADAARRLAPIHLWHRDIHENDIGARLHDAVDRLAPVFGKCQVKRQITHHLAENKPVGRVILCIEHLQPVPVGHGVRFRTAAWQGAGRSPP